MTGSCTTEEGGPPALSFGPTPPSQSTLEEDKHTQEEEAWSSRTDHTIHSPPRPWSQALCGDRRVNRSPGLSRMDLLGTPEQLARTNPSAGPQPRRTGHDPGGASDRDCRHKCSLANIPACPSWGLLTHEHPRDGNSSGLTNSVESEERGRHGRREEWRRDGLGSKG